MTGTIYDDTPCELGEGLLWHPEREELFWFDILGRRLHRKGQHWQFDDYVSAAGWVDADTLLMASGTALWRFDIGTGARTHLVDVEADDPATRSNDGRADPWGGYWIGTMGIEADPQKGAIYRYYRGALEKVVPGVTITNAICFSPDRRFAYHTDTPSQQIMRQPLNPDTGWPDGDAVVHVDLTDTTHKADGAVVDAAGNLWTAQWGSFRVASYDTSGAFREAIEFPAKQTSCPAFGGPDLSTLFCTSARTGLSQGQLDMHPLSGCTFVATTRSKGQREHRVIL